MNIEVSNVAKLPTKHGDFLIQSFKEQKEGGAKEHLVIFTKDLEEIPTVRIHSECLTGDAIGSIKCDCQAQLNYALDFINENLLQEDYLHEFFQELDFDEYIEEVQRPENVFDIV